MASLRTQTVVIGNERSSSQTIFQGSLRGPYSAQSYLFCTNLLQKLLSIINRTIHKLFYADDTQLYIAFKRNKDFDITTEISKCVQSVKEWSQVNGLKLNNIKTEFIHVSSRHRSSNPILTLNLDDTLVNATKICRHLGVTFDDNLTFENLVSQKCRSASFGLYKIDQIRSYLDKTTTERLIHAFVMSHFDFCNSLLFCLPSRQIQRLQVI